MPSLADDIANNAKGRVYRLRADEVLDQLEPKDSADLRAALNDPAVPMSAISDAMTKRSVTLSDTAIRRWRRANGVIV